MRQKMIEQDLVDCVIGLGPNLFYNSPMEACLLITTNKKPKYKKGKVLFINAVNEVRQDKTIGYLDNKHIERIFKAYQTFEVEENYSALVSNELLLSKNFNMAINLYVRSETINSESMINYTDAYEAWKDTSEQLKSSMNDLFCELEN